LLHDYVPVVLVRNHYYVVFADKLAESTIGRLQQSFASAQVVNKLLRLLLAAARPQTRSLSASQNNTIIIVVHAFQVEGLRLNVESSEQIIHNLQLTTPIRFPFANIRKKDVTSSPFTSFLTFYKSFIAHRPAQMR
jgi:hypothetical protein